MKNIKKRMHFLKNAFSDYNIGAVTMSSRYVIDRVLKNIPETLHTIIEYGPGDGVMTRELLKRLSPQGRFFAIETNAQFAEALRAIGDSRLEVIHGNANGAAMYITKDQYGKVDLVVSSIPTSFMDRGSRMRMVRTIYDMLAPGGSFIVFQQYQPFLLAPMKKVFGTATLALELRNIPPCLILYTKK